MAEGRVDRRLAAILAGDVAGYSRLMGADEEGTLSRLNAHRREFLEPKIAEHRGRIVKRIGDGVLIEFASAVDAVRCAVEIQKGMIERNASVPQEKRIEIRYGVHIGDIIIEEGDIFGDGVNIAARLEGIAQPGGICISDDAYRQVRGKLDVDFQDAGEQELKNIARPVRVYQLQLGSTSTQPPALALPDKPSIAVLPFQNLSGDPEQEYFTDGMVEDIITGLSRIKWLFVIARNTTFTYKGRAVDIKRVGRELGVRYVLEGSARKSAGRVRITGQLIEAESGTHLWADKFDGALDNIFDLQDKITEAVVGIIEPNVRRAEIARARRKPPENLGAYDLYLRALPNFASFMPADSDASIELLKEALRLDPTYAAAHALMALAMEFRFVRAGHHEEDAVAGLHHARMALAHGSDDATALSLGAFVILHLGRDFAAASGAIDRAVSLNPSCAAAFYWGAHIHAFMGDIEIAEDFAHRALRLSPFDPWSFESYVALGYVNLRRQRYDDAATCFAKAVQLNPRFSSLYAMQVGALGMAGRMDEAKAIGRRLLELEPGFHISAFKAAIGGFHLPEVMAGFVEGLGRAGLPE